MVRNVLRRDDVVELLGREGLPRPPGARVRRDRTTAVVRHHEVRRIVRVDPQVVEIAVREVVDRGHRLAGVARAEDRRVLHVHHVLVLRVGEDVRVIEGALADVALVVDQRPRRPRVVRLEEAALLVLDERVHPVRVRTAHRHADATHQSSGHARVPRDLRPALAAIGALEEPAALAAARHLVFLAVRLPHRRVEHVRIRPIDAHVNRRRLVVPIEHLTPRLAPVGALVHTALPTRHGELAERCDPDDVGIGGVDADLRDPVRLAEPHVRPRLAGIGALVDAIAGHDVAANARFAGANEDDVGIRLAHSHRAHARRRDLAVGHRRPVLARIDRLPESAAHGTEIRFAFPPLHAGHRDRPATAIGADVAPPVAGQQHGVRRARRRRHDDERRVGGGKKAGRSEGKGDRRGGQEESEAYDAH